MRFSFEGCVFDTQARELVRAGKPVSISPKAFGLLEVLVQRRPGAVSKDELHKFLWPDTFVSDANLPNLVAELRSALGDTARSPRIIRTVGSSSENARPGEKSSGWIWRAAGQGRRWSFVRPIRLESWVSTRL